MGLSDPRENLLIPTTGPQRRVRCVRTVIESDRGSLTQEDDHVTEVLPSGDILTTETERLLVIEGEAISSLREIKGVCQAWNCDKHLTARTFRTCSKCTKVICPDHSEWDDQEGGWLCSDCGACWLVKLIRWIVQAFA